MAAADAVENTWDYLLEATEDHEQVEKVVEDIHFEVMKVGINVRLTDALIIILAKNMLLMGGISILDFNIF